MGKLGVGDGLGRRLENLLIYAAPLGTLESLLNTTRAPAFRMVFGLYLADVACRDYYA